MLQGNPIISVFVYLFTLLGSMLFKYRNIICYIINLKSAMDLVHIMTVLQCT